MKLALVPCSFLALVLAGCASTGSTATPSDGPSEAADSKAERELEELERKLDIALAKLELSRLELDAAEAEHEARVRHAQAELQMAEAALERFRVAESPRRIAEARLNLQAARDRAQEAADELAQIEIMYEGQDLDDVTAEFVVSRGRRSAERAQARIELQAQELDALETRVLPAEAAKLELEVDKATTRLTEAHRDGEIGRHGKVISVKQAEGEVRGLERELEEKRKELES